MPCRDYEEADYTGAVLREQNDKLARLLCEAMSHYDKSFKMSKELALWWEMHQRADATAAMRKKQEEERKQKKQAALDKLSTYEKKLLGLS